MHHQAQLDPNLISPELLPAKDTDRTVNYFDLFFLWAAIAINLGAFTMALSMYPQLSPLTILGALFVGFLICIAFNVLIGDIGLTYGITYSVYVRSCFGIRGTHIPGTIRMFPALFWAGYQTFMAAASMNVIMEMVTGYSNIWVCIIIFQALQVINALSGVKSMAILNTVATVVLAIVLALIAGKLLMESDYTLLGIITLPAQDIGAEMSFPLAVSGAVGGWIAISPSFMDITRTVKRKDNFATQGFLSRNGGVLVATLLGILLVSPLICFSGLMSGIITGNWNPIDFAVEAYQNQPIILVICLIAIMLAQWSTNTASNMFPAANVIKNYSPTRISMTVAMLIVAIVSLVIQPWNLVNQLTVVLTYMANALGPVLGIMCTDYYIIRRRKLNVEALYMRNGQYSYWKEWNPAAIVSLVISFAASLLVRIDFGFFVGLPISVVLYYLLMKFWIIPKYPQEELSEGYQPNYTFDGTQS